LIHLCYVILLKMKIWNKIGSKGGLEFTKYF
jgi:hypothetical protein